MLTSVKVRPRDHSRGITITSPSGPTVKVPVSVRIVVETVVLAQGAGNLGCVGSGLDGTGRVLDTVVVEPEVAE